MEVDRDLTPSCSIPPLHFPYLLVDLVSAADGCRVKGPEESIVRPIILPRVETVVGLVGKHPGGKRRGEGDGSRGGGAEDTGRGAVRMGT